MVANSNTKSARQVKNEWHIISLVMMGVYYCSLIPMLVLAWFNYPSADDFSMANEVRVRFVESGSVWQTVMEAIRMAHHYYMNWCGYYFSDFLMAMPPSVFGERWYVAGTFILVGALTIGTIYFMDALLVRLLQVDRDLVRCITAGILFITVQCMPQGTPRVESFYWYAGAINYLFMYSVGLLYLGTLLRFICEKSAKKRVIQIAISTFLGFAMGGANYMSALSCAIISAITLLTVIVLSVRKGHVVDWKTKQGKILEYKRYQPLLLPTAVMLVGFALSCTAPGNAVRSQGLEGFGAVKSILISLLYTLQYAVDEWTTWQVLCLLILLLPLLWKAAKAVRWDFRYPFVAIAFFYGMTAANITPPIYAEKNIMGGRIQSLLWVQYIVCLVFALLYCIGWVQRNFLKAEIVQKSDASEPESSVVSLRLKKYFITVLILWGFGSLLCIKENPYYYTATAAVADLTSGSARQFHDEWAARYELLNDESVREVIVPQLSARPELLFFSDISVIPDDWANRGMCDYFMKDQVYSVQNQ